MSRLLYMVAEHIDGACVEGVQWTEVHDRMKEGERIYSDKFPIANVTGTW